MQYSLLTDKILSVIIITCQSRKVNSFSFVLHFAFNEIFHSVSVPPWQPLDRTCKHKKHPLRNAPGGCLYFIFSENICRTLLLCC